VVGATEIEVNTAAVTVNVAEPWIVPDAAFIVAVPSATLVANPSLLTVAIVVADDVQVAVVVRFCVVPLLYVPVAVNCCVYPFATDAVPGVTAIETREGAVPVPVSVTCCGLDPPVSATVRVPLRVPRAPGVKVIEIVQLAAAASVAGLIGQLSVSA